MIRVIKELFTPSNQTGPASAAYNRGAEAVWHAILGAFLMFVTGSIAFVFFVYLPKEIIDYFNGGTIEDCIEDASSVLIGALCVATMFWPMIIFGLGAFIFIFHALKK